MNVPRGITARDFTRALETDGFSLNRITGSHHIYTHLDGRIVPVAYTRESDTFPIGTLRSMVRLARWTEDDLRRLDLFGLNGCRLKVNRPHLVDGFLDAVTTSIRRKETWIRRQDIWVWDGAKSESHKSTRLQDKANRRRAETRPE